MHHRRMQDERQRGYSRLLISLGHVGAALEVKGEGDSYESTNPQERVIIDCSNIFRSKNLNQLTYSWCCKLIEGTSYLKKIAWLIRLFIDRMMRWTLQSTSGLLEGERMNSPDRAMMNQLTMATRHFKKELASRCGFDLVEQLNCWRRIYFWGRTKRPISWPVAEGLEKTLESLLKREKSQRRETHRPWNRI